MPNALAAQQGLTPLGSQDFVIRFNQDMPWYYGIDGLPPNGFFDFVTVALHEIGHGLGIYGENQFFADGTGQLGNSGRLHRFETFIKNAAGQSLADPALFPNDSAALGVQLTSGSLYFGAPGQGTRLHAPPIVVGTLPIYHLHEGLYPAGNLDSLMTPDTGTMEAIHDPGNRVRSILRQLGWTVLSPSVPDPPTNVMATVIGNNVTLAWEHPAPGGTFPTSYVVEVGVLPGQVSKSFPVGLVTMHEIAGPAGTPRTYFAAVRSVGGGGVGARSVEVTFVLPESQDPPDPPTGVTASVVGNILTLSWTPALTGGQATSFRVRASDGAGTLVVDSKCGSPEFRFPGEYPCGDLHRCRIGPERLRRGRAVRADDRRRAVRPSFGVAHQRRHGYAIIVSFNHALVPQHLTRSLQDRRPHRPGRHG